MNILGWMSHTDCQQDIIWAAVGIRHVTSPLNCSCSIEKRRVRLMTDPLLPAAATNWPTPRQASVSFCQGKQMLQRQQATRNSAISNVPISCRQLSTWAMFWLQGIQATVDSDGLVGVFTIPIFKMTVCHLCQCFNFEHINRDLLSYKDPSGMQHAGRFDSRSSVQCSLLLQQCFDAWMQSEHQTAKLSPHTSFTVSQGTLRQHRAATVITASMLIIVFKVIGCLAVVPAQSLNVQWRKKVTIILAKAWQRP